ncbi:MAG: carboxymuconolactone decarboxylase family protein [Azospirillaceae bacterium]
MSPGARIPLPEGEELSPAQRRVVETVTSGRRGELVGPLRAVLHNPDLADRWQQLGEALRFDTVFPPICSELAILLTARRWNSELEWVIHADAARQAGLPEEVITAIRERRRPHLADPPLREIYDYVSDLQNTGQVRDEYYANVRRRWGAIGLVELTAISGYYTMVAMTLNAHRIPLPEGRRAELYAAGEKAPDELSQLPG